MKFSGKSLPVDRNLLLWPGNDFTLSFSLQIISGSCKTQREQEKKRKTQRARERTTQRESEQNTERARERTRAPIQPPTPIYLMPVTPSSARWSPRQTPQTHGEWELKLTPIQPNAPDPAQPVDHGSATPITEPNTDSQWVFRNRFTVHTLTSPLIHSPHQSNPSSRPTSRFDLCIIYIYVYIYIILFIYLFI